MIRPPRQRISIYVVARWLYEFYFFAVFFWPDFSQPQNAGSAGRYAARQDVWPDGFDKVAPDRRSDNTTRAFTVLKPE